MCTFFLLHPGIAFIFSHVSLMSSHTLTTTHTMKKGVHAYIITDGEPESPQQSTRLTESLAARKMDLVGLARILHSSTATAEHKFLTKLADGKF